MSAPAGEFPLQNFYPLFEMLQAQITAQPNHDTQLTDEEIRTLITKIASMDKMGSDMIFVWIRIYSLRNSSAKILDVPYGGEKVGVHMKNSDIVCNAKFDMRNFPPILSRMLDRFTTLHLKRMEEDSQRAMAGKISDPI
jgi:hypothetical protein